MAGFDPFAQEVRSYGRGLPKTCTQAFESANIKIDSVVSDLFGVTGRNLMNLLVSDRKALTLADIHLCVRGKLKGKEEELYRSIQGFFRIIIGLS